MCVEDRGRRGTWGKRKGEELRKKHLFSKCVSSAVMGVKCLFELWVIPESQEQSYLSRSGNILHELACGLEELLHRDPLSVASTCLSLGEGWSGP